MSLTRSSCLVVTVEGAVSSRGRGLLREGGDEDEDDFFLVDDILVQYVAAGLRY